MSIVSDTRHYEAWLRKNCDVVNADLMHKHKRMRKNAFVFLRATYYRWARRIERWCPELMDAPDVLSVGDTHTENFGTWRDREGRLVWGVNDFDESAEMPYTLDLVRLATSVVLAPKRRLAVRDACLAILSGYRRGLAEPRPTLLDEHELWMRPFVACSDDDRKDFWREVSKYPDANPPRNVIRGLERRLPRHARIVRFCTRVKGGGSLGRPRYLVIATWRGGQIVREAKASVPSAWEWAKQRRPEHLQALKLATKRFRSPDPFFDIDRHFIYRRIAADARRVELGDNAGAHLNRDLLRAMGFELGAIHAAGPHGGKISRDLRRRRPDWLRRNAGVAVMAVRNDYEDWCKLRGDKYKKLFGIT